MVDTKARKGATTVVGPHDEWPSWLALEMSVRVLKTLVVPQFWEGRGMYQFWLNLSDFIY